MTKPGMAAQSVSWSGEGPLTFEDVSKLFSLPIAEAAQQLSEQSNPIFYFLFCFPTDQNLIMYLVLGF